MITRSLDKAKSAYKKKDVKATKEAHDAKHSEPHQHNGGGKYIKSMVYGGLDGIITTFAVVAGVAGANLSPAIVLILGFANLLADGTSMAFGDFLSTKAEHEYYDSERKREAWEVEHYPEGEKKEMVEIYQDKGLNKKDATTMVNILAKHKDVWIDTMMIEELDLHKSDESPTKNALVTFTSFVLFGAIPLVTYILSRFFPMIAQNTFLVASILTGCTLFLLGTSKTKITGQNWFVAGTEMLLVGGIAATLAYLIGAALSFIA